MSRKKLTVYDYLQCKGKRQLSVMFVHNADEAAAAEEAGIDMICTSILIKIILHRPKPEPALSIRCTII